MHTNAGDETRFLVYCKTGRVGFGSRPRMKMIPPFFCSVALLAGLTAGCGHLDVTPQDDPNRVLNGTVVFGNDPMLLPDDAVVVVSVIDAVPPPPLPMTPDNQMLKRPVPPPDVPPEVLGEQTIRHPGDSPIPFRIEYRAESDQLRHGLNIEARVSYGGRVRYLNLDHCAIGLNDYADPQTIRVDAVAR
jgi:uncharacterized lipoprotein YbaY